MTADSRYQARVRPTSDIIDLDPETQIGVWDNTEKCWVTYDPETRQWIQEIGLGGFTGSENDTIKRPRESVRASTKIRSQAYNRQP